MTPEEGSALVDGAKDKLREAFSTNGVNNGSPLRTLCPYPRVLRPCERPAPSRVSRLAPSAIAALIGFCAGADPSFEAFNRDRERGRK